MRNSPTIDYNAPFGFHNLTDDQKILVWKGHQIPPHCGVGPYLGIPVQPPFKLWEIFPSIFRSPCLPPATEEEKLTALATQYEEFYTVTVPYFMGACFILTFVCIGVYQWYLSRLNNKKMERVQKINERKKERAVSRYDAANRQERRRLRVLEKRHEKAQRKRLAELLKEEAEAIRNGHG
jgi:hypothetical protein|tara:strand:- start:124 stop:663 length:540 start_codon:yes stop_codon:yes gene_type:complete